MAYRKVERVSCGTNCRARDLFNTNQMGAAALPSLSWGALYCSTYQQCSRIRPFSEVEPTVPTPFLLLNEAQIRSCVDIDAEALAAVEDGFARLARGEVIVPPPIGIDVPDREAEVHVKTAYVHGLPAFAVKVASGFYANPKAGLAVSSGLMVVLSAETGLPQALLLDNAYLTEVRTALAGAVAAKYLAPGTVEAAGVIGVGMQARFQLRALRLVRDFRKVVAFGRRPEAVRKFAAEVSAELHVEVVPAKNPAEVVRRSEVVVTATPAREPLITLADLHEGLHITAMGSDGPGKQELDPRIFQRADLVVCDLRSQCERLGELQHAVATGIITDATPVVELGELAAGKRRGRRRDSEITVCDLTGVGVQDTAIACFVLGRAQAKGLGTPSSL
jgi:ectoine utilization protein EutC